MDYQAATRELIVELEEAQSKLLKYQEKEIKELKEKLDQIDQIDQKEQVDELYEKTIPYMELNKKIETLEVAMACVEKQLRDDIYPYDLRIDRALILISNLKGSEGGDTSANPKQA